MTYAEKVEALEAEGLITSDAQAVVDAQERANPFTATYSPDDNKLRISCAVRIDSDTFARLKAAGYSWAQKQGQMVAPMWTPAREDLALELAGEIGDEDTTLLQRAEDRADRFEDYSGKRSKEAASAKASADAIAGGIPLGQPILIGHHSQRRAEKDAQRIENGLKKAVKLWETADYWKSRAAGAIAHAKYKEKPEVRARRIKGIEADKRKLEKATKERELMIKLWTDPTKELTLQRALAIANSEPGHLSFCFPLDKYPRSAPASQYEGAMSLWSALDGGVITPEQAKELAVKAYTAGNANRARWVAHYDNRLTYEKAMLEDQGQAHLIAPKARPKQLPLVNYKQDRFTLLNRWHKGKFDELEQIELTNEQYMAINEDCRGTRIVDNSHRVRVAVISRNEDGSIRRFAGYNGKTYAVFLTDSKTHAKPAPVEKEEAAPYVPERVFNSSKPSEQAEEKSELEKAKEALAAGVKVVSTPQLFPTPEPLASRLVDAAQIEAGDSVLEPSAGTGALLEAIDKNGLAGYCKAVEISPPLADIMAARFKGWTVENRDFLEMQPDDLNQFDRIVMNPPFAGQADIAHVTHALKFLKEGGKLVAIMSAGVEFRQDKKAASFREMIERMGGTIEALSSGSFEESGTAVNTVLVEVWK